MSTQLDLQPPHTTANSLKSNTRKSSATSALAGVPHTALKAAKPTKSRTITTDNTSVNKNQPGKKSSSVQSNPSLKLSSSAETAAAMRDIRLKKLALTSAIEILKKPTSAKPKPRTLKKKKEILQVPTLPFSNAITDALTQSLPTRIVTTSTSKQSSGSSNQINNLLVNAHLSETTNIEITAFAHAFHNYERVAKTVEKRLPEGIINTRQCIGQGKRLSDKIIELMGIYVTLYKQMGIHSLTKRISNLADEYASFIRDK